MPSSTDIERKIYRAANDQTNAIQEARNCKGTPAQERADRALARANDNLRKLRKELAKARDREARAAKKKAADEAREKAARAKMARR